jgi:endonuclease YncB( thermonuclease family)
MDKGGTAIGTLWYTQAGQRTNLGEDLVSKGLAKLNEYSANMSKHGDALFAAVVEPKQQRLRVWESYDEAAELAAKEAADALEGGLSISGKSYLPICLYLRICISYMSIYMPIYMVT